MFSENLIVLHRIHWIPEANQEFKLKLWNHTMRKISVVAETNMLV